MAKTGSCYQYPSCKGAWKGSVYRKEARLVGRPPGMPGTSHPVIAQVLTRSSLYLCSYMCVAGFVIPEEDIEPIL